MTESDTFLNEETNETTEIGLTPLIDVIFQLLVFFMVTSSFVTPSVLLELPETTAEVEEHNNTTILVEIDHENAIYINGLPVSSDEIKMAVQSAALDKSEPSVALRADKATPYATVAKTMSSIGDAGVHRIHFVFESETR
jgi:biopolymer transport protein ExbD